MKTKVSVIITNYNYVDYIESCVESVLQQTHTAELIIVDDGSTDGSRELLRRYSDRAKLEFQPHEGQARAFNKGFSCSSGEIVMFLDADDMLMPQAVETIVSLWTPELSKLHFKLQGIDEAGRQLSIVVPRPPLANGDVKNTLLKFGHYVTPPTSGNAFARRVLLDVTPIKSEWPFTRAADAYLLHCVPFYGPIRSHERPLGYYRFHGRNISAQVLGSSDATVKKLRDFVTLELAVRKVISAQAETKRLMIYAGAVVNHHSLLKVRLALCKYGACTEEFPNDTVYTVAAKLAAAVFRCESLDNMARLALCAWAIAVAVLPGRLGLRVVSLGLSPLKRPRLLRRLIMMWERRHCRRKENLSRPSVGQENPQELAGIGPRP